MAGLSRILVDGRWSGSHGIGRYAAAVLARLPLAMRVSRLMPLFGVLDPAWLSAEILFRRAQGFYSPGFSAPVLERVPLVITVHDLNYVNYPANSDPLRRAYFDLVVRRACRRAASVITVSEYSRTQIVEWSGIDPGKVVNCGAGVDGRFCPDSGRCDLGFPYLLSFSNGRPHKNISNLIHAFSRSRFSSRVRLVIVGELDQTAKATLSALPDPESVILMQHIQDQDLPNLYRGATALCTPSAFEGFGLPVVEAMACGVPVVTSTATSLPEVAGDAAVLVDAGDVESIARGLVVVVDDQEIRNRLISRGLARAKGFSWDKTARRVLTVLESSVS